MNAMLTNATYQAKWWNARRRSSQTSDLMATTVKVSSRNQIVIPSAVRDELCIGPGDRLLISRMIDGQVNPVFAIEEMSFYEVTDWMIFPRHAPFITTSVTNLRCGASSTPALLEASTNSALSA